MSKVSGFDQAVQLGIFATSAISFTIGAANNWAWSPLFMVPVAATLAWPHLASDIEDTVEEFIESLRDSWDALKPKHATIEEPRWPTKSTASDNPMTWLSDGPTESRSHG